MLFLFGPFRFQLLLLQSFFFVNILIIFLSPPPERQAKKRRGVQQLLFIFATPFIFVISNLTPFYMLYKLTPLIFNILALPMYHI
ncbi:hypothetical protein HanPSC8_Chr04g0172721 [Helianthus annuus]|nr:hypothetical protein HanPSC8_Chr04g0172721 [Helianthus annuus]